MVSSDSQIAEVDILEKDLVKVKRKLSDILRDMNFSIKNENDKTIRGDKSVIPIFLGIGIETELHKIKNKYHLELEVFPTMLSSLEPDMGIMNIFSFGLFKRTRKVFLENLQSSGIKVKVLRTS